MIDAVVLAAGQGRRLGGVAKALLDVGGRTLLERLVASARSAGVERLVIVTGAPHADAVEAAASALGTDVARNPEPARGMASSVEVGFSHLLAASSATAALLWPVDTALVAAETVALITADAAAKRVVVPTHEGRGGHPVCVGRELWAALAACGAQKEGARSVFRHNQEWQRRLPVSDPMVRFDIDQPADLDAARNRS